jgi:AsmA protein
VWDVPDFAPSGAGDVLRSVEKHCRSRNSEGYTVRRGIRYLTFTVIVVLALLVSFPFLVGVDQFRPLLEARLSSTLGRDVKVGKMRLSILSGAFSADDLSISDDPAFSKIPFLTARSLKVGVELKPLIFSKSVRITRILIEEPVVALVRGRNGKWNFSSLGSAAGGRPAPTSDSKGGGGPDAVIQRLELVNGKLSIGSQGSDKRTVYDKVRLEAESVSMTSQSQVRLSASLPEGGMLRLDGSAGPIEKGDASLSPVEASLSIQGLRLAETGFVDPASGIAGVMDFKGNVTSRRGQAHARGDARLNSLKVVKGGFPAAVPVTVTFDSAYDLVKRSSTLKLGTVKVGSAVLNLSGSSRSVGDSTYLEMTLAGQDAPVTDLQALLPAAGVVLPKGASLSRGTMNVRLNITGPVARLLTSGDVGVFDAELAGFDMGAKLSALSSLAGLQGGGGKTLFQKVATNLKVSAGGIEAGDLQMIIPSIGELRGSGTIAPDTAMNFRMSATLAAAGLIGGTINRLVGRNQKDTRIPFFVRGKTSDPKFLPDVAGMAQEVIPPDLGSTLRGLFSKPKKN